MDVQDRLEGHLREWVAQEIGVRRVNVGEGAHVRWGVNRGLWPAKEGMFGAVERGILAMLDQRLGRRGRRGPR